MPVSFARAAPPRLRPLSPASFFTRYLRPDCTQAVPGSGRLHEAFQIYRAEVHGPLLALPTGPYRTTYHHALFITQGSFETVLGLHRATVATGSMLFVPAGGITSLLAISPDLRGYFLLVEPEFLAVGLSRPGLSGQLRVLARGPQLPVAVAPEQLGPLARLFEAVLAEYAGTEPTAELLGILLWALLLKIEQQYAALPVPAAGPPTGGSRLSAEQQLAHRFLDLLAARYHTWRTVAIYADHLCVTPNHLNRCVKRTTGRPTLAWITETLVREAKVLLRVCGLPVVEAARELGFRNVSYFGRLFRRHTGQTPSDYRENRKAAGVLT